jgi:hypothetical protein
LSLNFSPTSNPEIIMEKQLELSIEALQNTALLRDLLDNEVVLIGGGEVVITGH